MTATTPLQNILRDALDATDAPERFTLRDGLMIIGYPPHGNRRRIVAARQSVEPSDAELAVLRRELLIITQAHALTVVEEFNRLPPNPPWHGAECYINYPPRQANVVPLNEE